MTERVEIEYALTLNTELAYTDVRRLEISVFRILHMLEVATGDKTIDAMINKAQRLLTILRLIQISYRTIMALEAGTIGGPIGWLFAGTQVAGMGVSIYETIRGG